MRIAASTIDITPTSPTVLGGYMGGVSSSSVSERLEANLVVLRNDAESDPIVIISLDLLYPGRILRSALEAALPELKPDQLFLTASHTHQAPMTDDTKLDLGIPDFRYIDTLAVSLTREIGRMIYPGQSQDGICFTATVDARHSINRRLKKRFALSRRVSGRQVIGRLSLLFNAYVMAPNEGGPTDELLTMLIARSASGQAQFVIWNYACHPVSFPDISQIGAHFPHHVRDVLRASLDVSELPVLFLQGFSGNTRPSASVDKSKGLRSWTRRCLLGARFCNMTWVGYTSWAKDLGALVATGCAEASCLEDSKVMSRRCVSPASSFVHDAMEPDVSFHAIRFGPDLAIVGASAEVVAEYAPVVRAMTGSSHVMCVGCMDHPFGYAPTSRILHEGGYEGGGYCEVFGLASVEGNIQEEMLQGFKSVL